LVMNRGEQWLADVRSARLHDQQRVAAGVAEPEHRRHRILPA
jgi:hypothetical protein